MRELYCAWRVRQICFYTSIFISYTIHIASDNLLVLLLLLSIHKLFLVIHTLLQRDKPSSKLFWIAVIWRFINLLNWFLSSSCSFNNLFTLLERIIQLFYQVKWRNYWRNSGKTYFMRTYPCSLRLSNKYGTNRCKCRQCRKTYDKWS